MTGQQPLQFNIEISGTHQRAAKIAHRVADRQRAEAEVVGLDSRFGQGGAGLLNRRTFMLGSAAGTVRR